jgi:hypothetical protein
MWGNSGYLMLACAIMNERFSNLHAWKQLKAPRIVLVPMLVLVIAHRSVLVLRPRLVLVAILVLHLLRTVGDEVLACRTESMSVWSSLCSPSSRAISQTSWSEAPTRLLQACRAPHLEKTSRKNSSPRRLDRPRRSDRPSWAIQPAWVAVPHRWVFGLDFIAQMSNPMVFWWTIASPANSV